MLDEVCRLRRRKMMQNYAIKSGTSHAEVNKMARMHIDTRGNAPPVVPCLGIPKQA